jgi:hypothetical protein
MTEMRENNHLFDHPIHYIVDLPISMPSSAGEPVKESSDHEEFFKYHSPGF